MSTNLSKMFSLEDRVVVVTGATSGIGGRFVRFLLESGAKVAALGRNDTALAQISELGESERVLPVQVDITDFAAVEKAMSDVVTWGSTIDGLVAAAGMTHFVPAEDESPAMFAEVINLNTNALYACCHYAGKYMLQQGKGSIVTISSVNAIVASDGEAGYCASKGAVTSLTRELATQWASRGVRVNSIAPGYFHSEMTQHLFTDADGLARMSRSPMGRPGHDHELNGALAYLLSDASTFTTGETLVVDGGLTII